MCRRRRDFKSFGDVRFQITFFKPIINLMFTSNILLRPNFIRHAFFSREGGVSEGVYESLNCGFGSGDDPAKVRANQEAAMEQLDTCADNLATVHQCHSANVVSVEAPWRQEDRPKADAMVTNRPGVALGIMTADCGPVLFVDQTAKVIGAAHAGWRGALGGVLDATLTAMEQLGAKRQNIVVVLGPCIRQQSYEVSDDFKKVFVNEDAANGTYFKPAARLGHAMFDLAGFVVGRLRCLGVENVEDVAIDTYPEEEGFFSYRRTTHRGEKDYGRGLSVVMLAGE